MNIDIPGDIVVTANVKRALAAFDSLYYGLARFLLVCGATGSGKSTLARFLKRANYLSLYHDGRSGHTKSN
jgi:type IV secretory pathway VirB4 component